LNRKFGKYKVCGRLIYTPTPKAACAVSTATCARIVPAPVSARARSYLRPMAIHPRRDSRPLCSCCVHFKSRPHSVPMVAPTVAFVQRVHARYHASMRGVRALSHASAPHPSVHALVHPFAPFSTNQHLPRPCLDQRAHAPNRKHDPCALAWNSRRCLFHPHAPPPVYKLVCAPSLITLLLSILAFNCIYN
jgi:hypothetical protein